MYFTIKWNSKIDDKFLDDKKNEIINCSYQDEITFKKQRKRYFKYRTQWVSQEYQLVQKYSNNVRYLF